jgi:hypothetical protein
MEKEVCHIIEKDGVLSMKIDTNINTALNALLLFARTIYVNSVEDIGIEKDDSRGIIFDIIERAIEEGNEELEKYSC